jgi:Protein of unknown function/Domain of unknown function (DUF1835)
MSTLHIAPGDSAGGSILQAMRELGRNDEVLRFTDDLSCGPIEPDLPATRAAWWQPYHDEPDTEDKFKIFWDRVDSADEELVVWVSRHCAREYAFFLSWVDRMGARPYSVIDVTGRMLPGLSRPLPIVSHMQPSQLKAVLGTERPLTEREKDDARGLWSRLKRENAPFRVVTPGGMTSAPVEHFDPFLLANATTEWQRIIRLVHETIGTTSEPYYQVGDVMLLARVVALVGDGKLLADGDPWDMVTCRVRLPD